MDSHELARALLKHRCNDIRFRVIIENQNDKYIEQDVCLRDDTNEYPFTIGSKDIISYNPIADTLVVKIGSVFVKEFTGDTDD